MSVAALRMMFSPRAARRALALAAVASVTALAGCGDKATGTDEENEEENGGQTTTGVAGTYALYSIDGRVVPFTETDSGGSTRVNSGSLVLQSGGTFTLRFNETWTYDGMTETGVYGLNGTYTGSTTLVLTPTEYYYDGQTEPAVDEVPINGTRSAGTITLVAEDEFGEPINVVFKK